VSGAGCCCAIMQRSLPFYICNSPGTLNIKMHWESNKRLTRCIVSRKKGEHRAHASRKMRRSERLRRETARRIYTITTSVTLHLLRIKSPFNFWHMRGIDELENLPTNYLVIFCAFCDKILMPAVFCAVCSHSHTCMEVK
jgi:hypothetical protein